MPTEASSDDSSRPAVGGSDAEAEATTTGISSASTSDSSSDATAGETACGDIGEEDSAATTTAPDDVSPDVTVVRFIKTPHHIDRKRARLKPGAFAPPPGSDEVSVVRQEYGGDDYCKKMALEKVRDTEYYGLAPGVVEAVLKAGAKAVLDTPHVYDGHVDIIAPYVKPVDEPRPPEQTHEMQEFLRAMASHFVYYVDPDKSSPVWKGPSLARAS